MSTVPDPPGSYRCHLAIEAPGAISGLRLPHLQLVGAHDGPVTAITAGQHGREVVAVMAAALAFDRLQPEQVRGRIHVFPAVHPLALRLRSQDYPVESSRYRKMTFTAETNLDRMWGRESAIDPLLPAITSQLWDNCLAHCDHLLDLHAWSEYFCPMAWAHERDAALLHGTGYPYRTLRQDNPGPSLHTLREHAWSVRKPVVVVELQ